MDLDYQAKIVDIRLGVLRELGGAIASIEEANENWVKRAAQKLTFLKGWI